MTAHRVTTPQGMLAVHQYGTTGQPMICVPGLGDLRSTWRAFGPAMAEQGYVVYAMDLRGHGESDTGFSSYTTEDIGDDIVAVLRHFDLSDAVVVGNSIGGGAAVHAALAAPDRVQRLVLVNPFVRDMPNSKFMRVLVPFLFFWLWGAWLWAWFYGTLFKSPPADHADHHALVRANFGDRARLAAVRDMMRASKAGVGERLGELCVPSLVIMGSQDPDFPDPAAEGENLRRMLGGEVTVRMVDDAGHYPQIEQPDATVRIVADELKAEVRLGA